jgi:hypothetical protein
MHLNWPTPIRFVALVAVSLVAGFLFLVAARATNVFIERTPLPDYSQQIEMNNGVAALQALALYPRNERVLVASDPHNNFAYVASRTRSELKVVDLESFEVVQVIDLVANGLSSGELINESLYLFDLELAPSGDLLVSFVQTDRDSKTCDIYGVSTLALEGEEFGQLSQLWRSDVCRSVNNSTYMWPDFTGRMAVGGSYLYMSAGFSSMNMLGEYFPEKSISGVLSDINQELRLNDLFGKVTRISLEDGSGDVYAEGFRSPAGIAVRNEDGLDRVYVAEHGPRGGDELNLVLEGRDYGWPFVTLGTRYGATNTTSTIPLTYGTHEGYEQPIFSWTPSIAPSQLVVIKNSSLSSLGWGENDLVLSTLKEKSLFRIEIQAGKVQTVEPVLVGHRIRDLAVFDAGLVFTTDDGLLVKFSPVAEPIADDLRGAFPPITEISNNPLIPLISLADSVVALMVSIWQQINN